MSEIIEMEPAAAAQVRAPSVQRQLQSATPADLLRIAVEQNAGIEKLEQLMALQERHDANNARKAYVAAMADFKRDAPEIHKDKSVGYTSKDGVFTGYKHASLGNIGQVVIPSLAAHGFSHRWDTKQDPNGMITVTCIITHALGHSETTALEAAPDGSGKKNGIQQLASTVTYLQRYTLLGACGLSVTDMPDDDGRESEKKDMPIVKAPMSGARFPAALDSIRAGTYTAAKVRERFTLTVDQETALSDVEKECAK